MKSVMKMGRQCRLIVSCAALCLVSALTPAAQAQCMPKPSGIVAWWQAENNAIDSVGGANGTLFNGATYATGKVGQAFSFDGVNDRINVPDVPALHLADSLSIEAWIAPSNYPSAAETMILFRGDDRVAHDPYALEMVSDGHVIFRIDSDTQRAQVSSAAVVPLNVFSHIIATLDGFSGEMRIYVNGVLSSSITTTVRPIRDLDSARNPGLGIGNHGGFPDTPTNYPFPGRIDELAVYNRALTAPEIKGLYDAKNDGECDAASLSISDATVTEGSSGTATMAFTVSLSPPSAQTVMVQYQTFNGSATSPADYTALAPTTLIFAPGETSKTVNVTVQSDTLDELDETLQLILFNATNSVIGDGAAFGTIVDDDLPPTISIADVTQYEGPAQGAPGGSSNFIFTLSLSAPSSRTIGVNYATSDGTATQPSDYSARSGLISFSPGETSRTVSVPVVGDTTKEADETFFVNLSSPSNATLADAQAMGTILNDEMPMLSVTGGNVTEGNSGQTNATFTVTLSEPSTDTVSFDFTTQPGTAAADVDYVTTSGSRSLLPGETTKTITVPVNGDSLDEANETFYLALSNPVNALLAPSLPSDPSGHSYELVDTSQITWDAARDAAAARTYLGVSGHLITITSQAEQNIAANLSGSFQTWIGAFQPAGSVEPAGGFQWITGEPFVYTNWISGEPNNAPMVGIVDAIQFKAGGGWNDTSTQDKFDHYLVEYETTSGVNNPGMGTATIVDDDASPTLAVKDITVTEGTGGTTNAVFTISVTNPGERLVAVDVTTENGSAISGADFQGVNRTVIIPAGQSSATVTVPVIADLIDEDTETFKLNLSSAVNATITDGVGQGTITDDDAAPGLSINDISVAEGNSGNTAANFTVSLSAPSSKTVTVKYATGNPSSIPATAGVDYVAVPLTTLTFAPGQTTKQVTVQVNGDTDIEGDERFLVKLSTATNATIADSEGFGTILEDDTALSIDNVTVTEGNSGSVNATFTISLSVASSKSVTLKYATGPLSSSPATAGEDYVAVPLTSLTFAPGQTSKTVMVKVNGDLLDEVNEKFSVNLSSPANAKISDGEGICTITDDDAAPTLSINDVTQAEGDSGTTAFNFTVTLSAASGKAVALKCQTTTPTGSPATAGVDYTALPLTTLTFAPGETTKTVTVQVNGDTTVEGNEKFVVRLSNPSNATIADGEGFGTITNDDAATLFFEEDASSQ